MSEVFDIVVALFSIALIIFWMLLAYRITRAIEGVESAFKTVADALAEYLRSPPRE